MAVAGVASLWRYPAFIVENAATRDHGTNVAAMFRWNGLMGAATGEQTPGLATLLALPFAVAGVAIAVRAWRRPAPDEGAQARHWALPTVAPVLADPNLFLQDLVLLLPAGWWLIASARGRERQLAQHFACALWIACAAGLLWNALHVNVVALLLVAALAWLARAPSHASISLHNAPPDGPLALRGAQP